MSLRRKLEFEVSDESADSMLENSDVETKSITSSRPKHADELVDSDYSSKSSYGSTFKKKFKQDEEEIDEKETNTAIIQRKSTRAQTKSKPFEAEVKRKTRAKEEDDSDEDYAPNKKPKSKKKSARTRKTVNAKKDDWVDDESHDSVSSCEEESDQEVVVKTISLQDKDILEFYNEASENHISSLLGITDLKLSKLVSARPYESIDDIKIKSKENKLTTYAYVSDMLKANKVVNNLLQTCQDISKDVTKTVNKILKHEPEDTANNSSFIGQPSILNKNMTMKSYQIVGLNWLAFMHSKKLNSVLADEMGLGKTCQAIAFLAHLYEQKKNHMHLIVVPSSTLDNWTREIQNWFPDFRFIVYRGSPNERAQLRNEIRALVKKKYSSRPLNAILTTYNYVSSNEKDKAFMKSLTLEYCVYDEAHQLKNMATIKYKALMQIKSKRKLLLTGTPLQNNLMELMSLLYFVMPSLFQSREKQMNKIFLPSKTCKEGDAFYQEKIKQAKGIMNPFILRRLKLDVLKELPKKVEQPLYCQMSGFQRETYENLRTFYKRLNEQLENNNLTNNKLLGQMTELRKVASHPLLIRTLYTDEKIREMADLITKQSDEDTNFDYVVEDMSVMNDFELHELCPFYEGLEGYRLTNKEILASAKFDMMNDLLEEIKQAGDRVLIFSQFKIMLDIIEEYLRINKHAFLRLDGSTKVEERQGLIDQYNQNKNIFVFLLTTKAGGVGINLTGANRVIIHDIDFNPHNDKQAEDRCHRVGQEKEVQVYKLITKNSIDETMVKIQVTKLELDVELSDTNKESHNQRINVIQMFKEMLD